MEEKLFYDVIVVGGGHAGVEAAHASSKMGCKTLMITMNFDSIASMPCNPSIGGTAKGQLVREIDALGGVMGVIADETTLQFRMLNKSKGPGVHSPRAQVDRKLYQTKVKSLLERQENLHLIQNEVVNVQLYGNRVSSIVTATGTIYNCRALIIATGTYLNSVVRIGHYEKKCGPDGLFSSSSLAHNLLRLGISFRRFKTGTPPRVHKRSINFDLLECQESDLGGSFSFRNRVTKHLGEVCCYIAYTNEITHEIILNNLEESSVYSGKILGVGPRYCPSIEDKIVRFSDKSRHQLFVEPMGLDTSEMYIQGLSTSMPERIQERILTSIKGFNNVEVMRYAYAIEYECCDPKQLLNTLEFKEIKGLYGAGQFNGTSGYEEAAAQGIIAGINAALSVKNKEPFTLDRSEAYIGVLIDDLTTKGTNEPYRMLTSRAEYRLYIRQDNSDARLTRKGHELGLIDQEFYQCFLNKMEKVEREISRVKSMILTPNERILSFLTRHHSAPISTGVYASEILKRPEMSYQVLREIDENAELNDEISEQVEISIKYEGYIERQIRQIEKFKKNEHLKIPLTFDYLGIKGLRLEARQKLAKEKPTTLGEASRVSGVSPADILVLMMYIK